MVGDIVTSEQEVFEVVWSGGEGLIGDRPTKPSMFWTPPKRIYNKKSDYWKKLEEKKKTKLSTKRNKNGY